MSEAVKQDGGRGTRRADQARATRRRIIDQAARLFAEQGYAATTLDQIAAAADVAVQTVYFHFRNKATVLKEVVDVLAVGDDEPVPVLDRPWVRRMREEPDGARALAIWLRNTRAIFGRVAPVMKIVRDAAGSDPQMAAQWQTSLAQRYAAQHAVAAAGRQRRTAAGSHRAADIVLPRQLRRLPTAHRRRAGYAQWERWITATLTATDILPLNAVPAHLPEGFRSRSARSEALTLVFGWRPGSHHRSAHQPHRRAGPPRTRGRHHGPHRHPMPRYAAAAASPADHHDRPGNRHAGDPARQMKTYGKLTPRPTPPGEPSPARTRCSVHLRPVEHATNRPQIVGGMEHFSDGLTALALVRWRHSVTGSDALRWVSV